MFSDRSRPPVLVGLAVLSAIFLPACDGRTTARSLEYEQIITCNVVVEHHFMFLSAAAFKRRDGTLAEVERDEIDQRREWLSLAAATGRSPEIVQRDLIAERLKQTADQHQAEWNRLQSLYVDSEPSLRLMPYYKPLSAKEREDVRKRQHDIMEAAHQNDESQYRQCLSAL